MSPSSSSSSSNLILVDRRPSGVAVVTINRPGSLNSLTRPMLVDLAKIFKSLNEDPAVGAVVIFGRGRAFCSGIDLTAAEEVFKGDVKDQETDLVVQMERCRKPIIGAVAGFAVTAGFEIALACDIIVAGKDAKFIDTHARFGIFPSWGLSQKLSRVIGPNRARQVSLSCTPIDAENAEKWGLVNQLVESADVLNAAIQVAESILKNNRDMVLRYKSAINDGFKLDLSNALKLEKVLNAAMLYWPMPNTLYVEGYALDRFAEGLWALQPVHHNKVGLVLDAGMEEELQIRHLQVADASRASLGLPVLEYIVTDSPLEVEKWVNPKSGQSTGRIKNQDSLLRAVDSLVNHSHVNAVAVVGRFPDDDLEEIKDYRQGKGIDSLAGVEAVISHLIVEKFQIPCAHAPAILPVPLCSSLSPRSAAEEIGYTFLPCVLSGLSRAPQYVVNRQGSFVDGCIVASDIDSVILPIDACGGDAALAFARKNKLLIIAVEENETVLDDTPEKLGIQAVRVKNYWEAVGVIAAHKAGVDPKALRRYGIDRIKN